jgi:hypothetical protein
MAKTFNLKNYQKINGDEHIEMRLRNVNKGSEEAEVVNESQLEDYRATESDVLTEKMLEKVRKGSADRTVEARLESQDPKNGVKYRNPDAYTGDINKLEEKRLSSKPVEKEEYESATIKSKSGKWWDSKSPDGLKLASDSGLKKNAIEELGFDKPRWQEVGEDEGEGEGNLGISEEDDFVVEEKEPVSKIKKDSNPITIIQTKEGRDPIPHFYMKMHYNPEQFENDEEVKNAALEKVLSVRPELANFVTIENMALKGFDQVSVRAIGEELTGLVGNKEEFEIEEEIPGNIFEEINYEERDVEGTPMAFGSVKINTEVHEMNRDAIVRDIVDYINGKHPRLNLTEEGLDLSKLSSGEVSFIISVSPAAPLIDSTELPPENPEEFPVREE